MTTALLIAAVLIAVLACPAMMWWSARHGRSAPCCPRRHAAGEAAPSFEELRAEQQRLENRLARAEGRVEDGERTETAS